MQLLTITNKYMLCLFTLDYIMSDFGTTVSYERNSHQIIQNVDCLKSPATCTRIPRF